MINELTKRSKKKALPLSVLLIVLGIIFAAAFGFQLIANTNTVIFDQLTPYEISDQRVEVNLTASFGCFLEQYSENSTTKKQTTDYLYYVIYTGDDFATDFRYMAIRVPVKFEAQMEKLTEETYSEDAAEALHFVGDIRRLSAEEQKYFREFFLDSDWTSAEYDEGTIPYVIEANATNNVGGTVPFLLLILVSIAAVIWGVLRIVKASRGGYLKKFRADYESAGYTESSVDSDYQHGILLDKKDPLRFGRIFTYDISGAAPRAIANDKISWVYQKTTTHRTNGIKTGTTYSLVISAEGLGKQFELATKNEAACQKLLNAFSELMPWVVAGYNDEIAKLFTKQHNDFLDIRYNKVVHEVNEEAFARYTTAYRSI